MTLSEHAGGNKKHHPTPVQISDVGQLFHDEERPMKISLDSAAKISDVIAAAAVMMGLLFVVLEIRGSLDIRFSCSRYSAPSSNYTMRSCTEPTISRFIRFLRADYCSDEVARKPAVLGGPR